ncbi:MAG: YigZ family protein [Defluviitaleaceae bacterium]|nr:YigZ family protein [Defluviitaleaceae bacterium]
MSDYLMPAKNGTHEIIIDRSRFICHVYRVQTVDEANAYINEIRERHSRANHHCVAYLIGEHNAFGRAADDGEPSGTAGAPMLDVLQRKNIRNCLVVVTRYFGGIKLGAGGLIRAYGRAVSESLTTIGLVRRINMQSIWLTCNYALLDTLQSKIKRQGYTVGHIEYSDRVKLEALVEVTETEAFTQWVVAFTHDTVVLKLGDISFKELPHEND